MMIVPTPWFVTFCSVEDDKRHYLFFEYEEHAQAWQAAQDTEDKAGRPMGGLFFPTMLATLGLTYGTDVVLASLKDGVSDALL